LTSPVLAALANAKAAEQAAEERVVTVGVLTHLGMELPQGDRSGWPVWQAFCDQRKIASLPGLPAAISVFILNYTAPDRLEKIIGSISIVHQDQGAADPTLSPAVIAALNQVRPIEPPRSWDATHKIRWQQLPRDVATYIRDRENDRDRALRQHMQKLRKEHHEQESIPAAGADRTTDTTAEPATAH
jgi:hypothetical protein